MTVLYPKKTEKDLYLRLLQQCRNYNIEILEDYKALDFNNFDLIVDGIFGFSFAGEIREPFKTIITVCFISIYFILYLLEYV